MKKIYAVILGMLMGLADQSPAQEVSVLVDAKFNQGMPYNMACPDGSVTGCGPTAIAEILNRYKMPEHGYGMASLVLGLDTIQVDMETIPFNWSNIIDEYKDGEYTEAQAKAVADMMYACGVAMNVKYGLATSVTNYARMLYGLQHNLRMSVKSRYLHRKNFSTSEWIEILNEQLRNGQPVFYRGTWFFADSRSDHMFVVDGLDADGNYHVNFGHGGVNDKYCDINVINQSGSFPGNRGVCYNASQAMTINLYPTPDFTDYPLQASVSEEPIILNGDIFLESIKVPLSESFTLSCRLRSCSYEKTTITFGWALIKEGEVLNILGQGRYGLSPGNTFKEISHRTVKLPAKLEDGDYKLILYSKSNLEEKWKEVWRDAATTVDVSVSNGMAIVTVPPNHRLDPKLYLTENIQEVDNEFASKVAGRSFRLPITNGTLNNFENNVKLDITADGVCYSYVTTLPVYSQTSTTYHILVPTYICNLEGKSICSIKASYYYDLEDRYIEMPIGDFT
ncbi:MAG: C10 family peptidase [Prevotella sp.]|nr:C10 family peptidase [Prevotella sp.]